MDIVSCPDLMSRSGRQWSGNETDVPYTLRVQSWLCREVGYIVTMQVIHRVKTAATPVQKMRPVAHPPRLPQKRNSHPGLCLVTS